jgi:hypothetical protein
LYFTRSPEPNFHPEFGLVCPSSTFRRVARVAIISIALGATVGAIAVFALVPRDLTHGERALNIIFADQAAAAAGEPAAIGKGSPPAALAANPATSYEPAPASLATEAESAATTASEEPKASARKKRKKVTPSHSRKRDRDVADVRDAGAFATPYGSRSGQPPRDGGWN